MNSTEESAAVGTLPLAGSARSAGRGFPDASVRTRIPSTASIPGFVRVRVVEKPVPSRSAYLPPELA